MWVAKPREEQLFLRGFQLGAVTPDQPACSGGLPGRPRALSASLQEGPSGKGAREAEPLWPTDSPSVFVPGSSRQNLTEGSGEWILLSPIWGLPAASGFSQVLPPNRKQSAWFPSGSTRRRQGGHLHVLSYLRQAACNWQPPQFSLWEEDNQSWIPEWKEKHAELPASCPMVVESFWPGSVQSFSEVSVLEGQRGVLRFRMRGDLGLSITSQSLCSFGWEEGHTTILSEVLQGGVPHPHVGMERVINPVVSRTH